MSDALHIDFEAAFAPGDTRFVDEDGNAADVRVVAFGTIDVDGVAIGDPLVGSVAVVEPPAGAVAGRDLPVELAVAAFDHGDERVAAARLRIRDVPVARWVEADVRVEVDAGTAAIASAAAVAPLYEREDVGRQIMAELERTYRHTWSAAVVDAAGADVAVFSSGFGDGVYAGWWGLAADGEPAVLALDFDVLPPPIADDFDIGRPAGRGRVASAALEERGVRVRVPWLRPGWLEVDQRRLAPGLRAYVRIRRRGAAGLERVENHRGARGVIVRVELREVPDDASLVVRLARGYRARAPA